MYGCKLISVFQSAHLSIKKRRRSPNSKFHSDFSDLHMGIFGSHFQKKVPFGAYGASDATFASQADVKRQRH